jgi:predicted metal-binding protein
MMRQVSCVFCLYTTNLQKFFKIDAKGRTIALVTCPECHNKMQLQTLIKDMSIQEYAKFVYGYRLSGFWKKCPFALFNQRLREIGASSEFWLEYKKLKGEYPEQNYSQEENEKWKEYNNER